MSTENRGLGLVNWLAIAAAHGDFRCVQQTQEKPLIQNFFFSRRRKQPAD